MRKASAIAVCAGFVLGLALSYIRTAEASRNSSGSYSLPSGNPVISGSTISSTWANNTLSDLATEMTDSLNRSGKGAMLAPMRATNGSAAAPSVTFDSDTDTGVYRIGADNLGVSVGGTKRWDMATAGSTLTGTLTVSGAATLQSTAAITGNTTVGGTLGVTGVTSVADGTVGTPGVNFSGDPNSGVYRIGADNIGISVNGTKAVDIATTGVTLTNGLTATTGTFSGNVTVSGTLTSANVIKAWANITNTTVNAGSGITSVACNSDCADITLTTAMSNTNYAVVVTPYDIGGGPSGTGGVPWVTITSTTVFRLCFLDDAGAAFGMCANNDRYMLMVIGS